MEVRAEFAKFYDVEADALVVTIYEGEKAVEGALKELDERTGGIVSEMLGSDEMRGKLGNMVFVHRPGNLRAGRLLLVGAGKREEFSLDTIRKVAGSAARFLRGKGARSMAVLRRSQLDIGKSAQAAVEGVLLGLFEPDMYKTENREERRIDELVLVAAAAGSDDELAGGVERGRIIGEAVNLARELSNEPSSTLTPSELAERAKETAGDVADKADPVVDKAADTAGQGWDKSTEAAGDVVDAAKDKVSDLTDRSGDAADEAAETAQDSTGSGPSAA